MFKDVFNILQGRRPEGGSTITQQVAKNVLLTNEATLGRKLKEAILATRLEQALTKKQILELYLNEIWLGHDSLRRRRGGLQLLRQVDLRPDAGPVRLPGGAAEGAGQLQSATPHAGGAGAAQLDPRGRWRSSAGRSPAEAEAAMREPIVIQPPQRAKYHDADYFVEEVRREALAHASATR